MEEGKQADSDLELEEGGGRSLGKTPFLPSTLPSCAHSKQSITSPLLWADMLKSLGEKRSAIPSGGLEGSAEC